MLAAVLLAGCTTDFDSFQPSRRDAGGDGGSNGGRGGSKPPAGGTGGSSTSGRDGGRSEMDAGDAASPADTGTPPPDSGDGAAPDPDDDAGITDPGDAGHDSGPPVSCIAGDRRCDGAKLQQCSLQGDAWNEQMDCGAASCNKVALACHACNAPVNASGALACAGAVATGMGSAIATVDTTALDDGYTSTCGGAGAPDRVVEWTAPSTGYWVLDTQGSSYDTVLAVRNCACDGAELGCDDDATVGRADSEVVARFTRGQRVAVILDGNSGAKGTAKLNANPVTCPAVDVDLASLPRTINDVGTDRTEALRFTPTQAGFYSIRAKGAANISMCLRDGPRCGGPQIACNSAGDANYGAQIVRELVANKPVTLEVQLGSMPSFQLAITRLAGAVCEDLSVFQEIAPGQTQGTLTNASPNFLTPSCAPAGVFNPNNSSEVPAPEGRFTFDVSANDRPPTIFSVYIQSDDPIVAYVLRDGCGGPEIACSLSTYSSATDKYSAGVDIPGTGEDRTYVVVIERAPTIPPVSPFTFTYQIAVLQ